MSGPTSMERSDVAAESDSLSRKKIKIIHLVGNLGIGGVQKVVLDICSAADLEQFDVSVYSVSSTVDLLNRYSLDPRIRVRTFDLTPDPDFSVWAYAKRGLFPSLFRSRARPLIEAVAEAEPDILHLHLVPRELGLGVLIRRITNCRLVFTQHLTNFPKETYGSALMGWILRLTYRKYDLISVSGTISDEIRRHGLVGRGRRLVTLENKLDLLRYVPERKGLSEVVQIVYVARIAPVKGHEDLLRAWKLLEDSPFQKRLAIVGPDSMDGRIHRLAGELGVAEGVVFLGPSDRVTDILNYADIAVYPSHQEGLPLALLEKMAMKLPVVVSDIPELTAIITDGVNGLVFKCGNPDDLAKKLSLLIQDSELRKRLGEAARGTVEKHYGSFNIAEPNERFYLDLMSYSPPFYEVEKSEGN